jgi:hypothetical protein
MAARSSIAVGPTLGQHNLDVFCGILGMSESGGRGADGTGSDFMTAYEHDPSQVTRTRRQSIALEEARRPERRQQRRQDHY